MTFRAFAMVLAAVACNHQSPTIEDDRCSIFGGYDPCACDEVIANDTWVTGDEGSLPQEIAGNLYICNVTVAELPALTYVATVDGDVLVGHNQDLTALQFSLDTVGGAIRVFENNSLSTVEGSQLRHVGTSVEIIRNSLLTSIQLPALAETGGVFAVAKLPALNELYLPTITNTRGLTITEVGLVQIDLALLETVGFGGAVIDLSTNLQEIRLDSLWKIEGALKIRGNDTLTSLAMSQLAYIGPLEVTDNPHLPQCQVELLRQQIERSGGISGAVDTSGNDPNGICE